MTHELCFQAIQSKAWIFFKVPSPSFDTLPLEHHQWKGIHQAAEWQRVVQTQSDDWRRIISRDSFWEESALFLPLSDHSSADHISESHSHCKYHKTMWRWWYTIHRADAVLTVHLQRKHVPVPGVSYHLLLNWTVWLLVLMSSSGRGHCCPDLQFWSTSLGLGRKWNEENWSMRLPYTQHPSKRHSSTLDLMSFP